MGTRTQEGRRPGNARGRPSMWGPTRREAAGRSATVRIPPCAQQSRRIGARREPSGGRYRGGGEEAAAEEVRTRPAGSKRTSPDLPGRRPARCRARPGSDRAVGGG